MASVEGGVVSSVLGGYKVFKTFHVKLKKKNGSSEDNICMEKEEGTG